MTDRVSEKWFAVMHVMSRLGFFKPYLYVVQRLLDLVCGIDRSELS